MALTAEVEFERLVAYTLGWRRPERLSKDGSFCEDRGMTGKGVN